MATGFNSTWDSHVGYWIKSSSNRSARSLSLLPPLAQALVRISSTLAIPPLHTCPTTPTTPEQYLNKPGLGCTQKRGVHSKQRMCNGKQHRARAHSADIGGLLLATSDVPGSLGRGWMGTSGPGIEYVRTVSEFPPHLANILPLFLFPFFQPCIRSESDRNVHPVGASHTCVRFSRVA